MPITTTIQQFQGGTEVLNLPQYLTKHFDDYLLQQQLKDEPEVEQVGYCQKWQTSDTIKLQYESTYSPINISLIDHYGDVIITLAMTNKGANIYEPGKYIFEAEMSFAGLPEGCYFLKRECGSPVVDTCISEPISIKVKHKRSIYAEYSNSSFHGDVVFETGITFAARIPADLLYDSPGSERFTYTDQELNPTVLKSKPFRVFNFIVGNEYGVPKWVIDKLNWIFSCDTITLDGKPFSALDDFKIDQITEDGTWMTGANILLREGINRSSIIRSTTINTNKKLVLVYNIESKIFGTLNAGGSNNTTPIKAIE